MTNLTTYMYVFVSGQLPTRTIPHHVAIGPDDEWSYSLVMDLVGSPGGALTFEKGRGVRPQNLKPYP